MSDPTRLSLVLRLRDGGDAGAWGEFVRLYTPVVYGYVRRRGLQAADAEDVTQEVFRAVAGSIERFRKEPGGSFRGWLRTITRCRLADFLEARRRQLPGGGANGLQDRAAPAEDEAAWDREYQQGLLRWAAAEVRPSFQEATWQAFWQTAMEGRGTREVAAALGLSEGAVYIARCRVLARLRQKIAEVDE